jgi:hypothetical protein
MLDMKKKPAQIYTIERASLMKTKNYTQIIIDEAASINFMHIIPIMHENVISIKLYGNKQ